MRLTKVKKGRCWFFSDNYGWITYAYYPYVAKGDQCIKIHRYCITQDSYRAKALVQPCESKMYGV
jgi:hypothetical protein